MSAKQTGKGLLFFAPLQGFTEAPYRKAHHEVCGGVDAYYAPFVRLEKGEIRKKDLRDLSSDFPCPLIPQVIAADAEEFERLTRAVMAQGYTHIDFNLGCPFPMQTRAGRGAGLLPHPDRLQAIGEAMTALAAEAPGLSFSVKMRLGLESADESLALLPVLNAMPLAHITLHPRLGKQQYKGPVDIFACQRFLEQSEHPVVYNGDILSIADAERVMKEMSGLKGLMIGRGLLSRPTLAAEIKSGQALPEAEVRRAVLQIHERVFADYSRTLEGGEAQILQKMLPFWEYQEPLFGHKAVKLIRKSRLLQDYRSAVLSLSR